jgi:hypothetical protein
MGLEFFVVFVIIAVFCVLHYLMFITRRTILRVFGRAAVFFAVGFIFIYTMSRSRSPDSGINSTEIINDLLRLRSAAIMLYVDFKTWPLPGQEASLDRYCDRPIVLAKPFRYTKVMLIHKSGNADGTQEHYIGVELIPPKTKKGEASIQRNLAAKATNAKLLQRPISGDIYTSGLSVYMQVN